MRKTISIICMQAVFCTLAHAGVVNLEFESFNGEAYAYAFAEGSTQEERTIEYNEHSAMMPAEAMAISTYIF